jgi:hypothetical protein
MPIAEETAKGAMNAKKGEEGRASRERQRGWSASRPWGQAARAQRGPTSRRVT